MTDRVTPEHLLKTERGEAVTLLEAISEALFEEMIRDETVFLMGEDIGTYGGAFKVTRDFLQHFGPQRVIDTPIAEGGFTGAAAGAAHMGLRPVVEMQFMDFISPAYDVITNYIATSLYRGAGPMPLVIRGLSVVETGVDPSTLRTSKWRSSIRRASRSCTRAILVTPRAS